MSTDKKVSSLKIALVVVIIIILFVIFIGNVPKWFSKSEGEKFEDYNAIDFDELNKNFDKVINERKEKLMYFKEKRIEVKKKIDSSINRARQLIVVFIILINIGIYSLYKLFNLDYGINQFVLWNEAFLISIMVLLFMLSEKYSNLKLAFSKLKVIITRKIYDKWKVHRELENRLKTEIELLLYLQEVHPSYLKGMARKKQLPHGSNFV